MEAEINKPKKLAKQKRKITLLLSISLFVLYSIYSFLINPLYASVSTNINYQLTMIPTLLVGAFILIYILSIIIYVSISTYGVYKFGLKGSIPLLIITCVGIVYLHTTDTLMMQIVYSYNATFAEIMDGLYKSEALIDMVLRILSDIVFFSIIVVLAVCLVERSKKKFGDQYKDSFYPIKKFINLKNPLQLISLIVAVYVLGYLIISDTIFLIKDAGNTVQIFVVIGEYLIKLIIGFISYVAMLFAYIIFEK